MMGPVDVQSKLDPSWQFPASLPVVPVAEVALPVARVLPVAPPAPLELMELAAVMEPTLAVELPFIESPVLAKATAVVALAALDAPPPPSVFAALVCTPVPLVAADAAVVAPVDAACALELVPPLTLEFASEVLLAGGGVGSACAPQPV